MSGRRYIVSFNCLTCANCSSKYVGYTTHSLHQRIANHRWRFLNGGPQRLYRHCRMVECSFTLLDVQVLGVYV